MFASVDFSGLPDPGYKEDAVREDIVAPILRAVGFSATGPNRMIRSKPLSHPYVNIGSTRKKLSIIPDYLLEVDGSVVLALDAKAPGESVIKSKHVEQAFSYAIHPEVRVNTYGLCNGSEIALYDINRFEPVLHTDITDPKNWDALAKFLAPRTLLQPKLRDYCPDLGMQLRRSGADADFNAVSFR